MRLPKTAHTARPWRIHEIAPDFRVEDVWALPTPGGPDDLRRLVEAFTSERGTDGPPWMYRALFTVRWKLGALLGWDRPEAAVGARVASLRERLPADLRDGPSVPDIQGHPFTSVYLTHDEWVSEIANKTVHALMHIGWVPHGDGYRGQMTVLVKPNGLLGKAYMAAIVPFRYTFVYPPLIRMIGRGYRARVHRASTGGDHRA